MLPLCVDMDGSLIRNDMLHDSSLAILKHHPLKVPAIPFWLLRGKAYMKHRIADLVSMDAALLPYNEELIEWLRSEKQKGRTLVLATASNHRYARAVADHLALFDEVVGSDDHINLSSSNKANELVRRYGEKGFDYVGNSHQDITVWKSARNAIVVGSNALAAKAAASGPVAHHFHNRGAGPKIWIKGLRLHQWLKNLLVFLPLIGAHRWTDIHALSTAILAFISFGLSASAVYILNDLLDLESDRQHPRKRRRPFAAGLISVPAGILAATALFAGGLAIAGALGAEFLLWIVVYLLLTTTYSFKLKQYPLVDCLALAGLYTLRIAGGGAAVNQGLSFWLLAFSLFLFLSLAFIKRYSELLSALKMGKGSAHGRGYREEDLPLLQSIGLASAFSSALVMALYLNSAEVLTLYRHPQALWFTLPALLFWICWMWLKAVRDEMHDDPVVFAVRDRVSLVAGALFIGALWAAA